MSDVRNFVNFAEISYVVDLGWNIVFAHFIEAEIEESLAVLVCVQVFILSAILASSVVSKPDIVTRHGKLER